jgi:hypothetical protein
MLRPIFDYSIRLAPVLGRVAKQVKDKMAVGKLDCSRFRPTCAKYGIKGYPTLKYALDGVLYDYPGKPDEASMIAFAERMTSAPIAHVSSMEEAERIAHFRTDRGVAFLGADSKPIEESKLYSAFETVAKRHQATAHFLWLELNELPEQDKISFIQRLEPGVMPPREFDSNQQSFEDMDVWITSQNVPTLPTFDGPDEFIRNSKLDRLLVICVVDTFKQEQIDSIKIHMLSYIQFAPQEEVERMYFGILDGRWNVFLQQFGVESKHNPQFLMFDASRNIFWRNETYTTLSGFLKAVQDGDIAPQKKRRGEIGETGLHWIAELFFDYYPLSLGAFMISICLPVVLFTQSPEKSKPTRAKKSKKDN